MQMMTHPDSTPEDSSLEAMAEEIFSLTVMGWRQRLASRQQGAPELSESQFLALDSLANAAQTLTVGEIQRAVGVLPAQMSRIIRSLETGFEKPLIHCALNQTDKRKIDVTLTPEGRQSYDDYRNTRLAGSVNTFRKLSPADRADFIRVCRKIREIFAQSDVTEQTE
jgi:DNA-binding MarR family transcriptional regulator